MLIIGLNSCSVEYRNFVSVLRYDSSPFNYRIKHVWTGKENPIIAPDDLIRIWTDNGVIDTGTCYHANYKIRPIRNGKVKIYTLNIRKTSDGSLDTIKSITKFKAILPPKIVPAINERLLKDSLIIQYDYVLKHTSTKAEGKRYQIAALPTEIKVYKDNKLIGEIPFYTPRDEAKEIIKNGNRLCIPEQTFRDMRTDLIIESEGLDYKY